MLRVSGFGFTHEHFGCRLSRLEMFRADAHIPTRVRDLKLTSAGTRNLLQSPKPEEHFQGVSAPHDLIGGMAQVSFNMHSLTILQESFVGCRRLLSLLPLPLRTHRGASWTSR